MGDAAVAWAVADGADVGDAVAAIAAVGVAGEVAAGGGDCSPPPQPTSARGSATDNAVSASRICGKIRRRKLVINLPLACCWNWSLVAGDEIILRQK